MISRALLIMSFGTGLAGFLAFSLAAAYFAIAS
jgi:hypothetical protein